LKTFTIEGRFASWYDVGDELEVAISTGNDGTYTVVSVSELTGNTVITVAEAVPSAVADGLIKQKLLKQLAIKTSATAFEDKGLPAGFYYYVVYAVDKSGNYSNPSNLIIKTAPENIIAPAQPTGLTVQRTDDLRAMDIFWNANTEEDLKGYIVYRSFDGLTYDVIALQGSTSNNYKDTRIPAKMDTDSNTTPVIYAVSAYNKSFIESVPAGPTTPLEVPILAGLRGIIDYLAINVYWDYNKPEDGITAYELYYRKVGDVSWTFVGTANYPQTGYRIGGPLLEGETYEIGIVVQPYTGTTAYLQPLPIPISIPIFEKDTTRPISPEWLEADLDPENNRMFISWRRIKIDDDFLHYAIWMGRPFDIIAVDTVAKTFTVNGLGAEFFSIGEYIQVMYIPGNSGIYSIKAVSSLLSPERTVIEVNETIPSAAAGGQLFQLLLDGTTTQNNWTLRNMRRYFARESASLSFPITGVNTGTKKFTISGLWTYFFAAGYSITVLGSTGNDRVYTVVGSAVVSGNTEIEVSEVIASAVADGTIYVSLPSNRAFILAVTAVDRAGNSSILASTAFLTEYWMSQDIMGPTWLDVIRTINSGLFNEHDGSSMAVTPFAQFYLQWNDIGRVGKHFRRYIVFETVDLNPSTGIPLLDFDDDTQIRGFTGDNTFVIHNRDLLRGFSTTTSERVITSSVPASKTFDVFGDQRGHFRPGDTLVVYGSTGYDGTYTISTVSFAVSSTTVTVVEPVTAGSGGSMYDEGLDKLKWYAVIAEDWFGDRYAGSPYQILEVK